METPDEKLWLDRKIRSWERLWEDLEIGYLDRDIIDILVEFFLRPKSFTTSSCSGRIVVMDAEYPWDKEETMIIFKKHEPVTVDEIIEVVERPLAYRPWLSVQGPIIHVETLDIDEAFEVLEIARRAGFKHSGILASTKKGILVELRTGIRVNIPLGSRDNLWVDKERLRDIISLANNALRQAKDRLARLRDELRKARPASLWSPPSIPPAAQHYLKLLGVSPAVK
ncbi:protein of unknown function DUF207 [Pyrolobus fumarii 1A]|uniref:tRNA(Phe) 7-((3-amino-3-carboxypropyl)-4-demethylwyosine(37)-N(4))-methyltransferase n=1 Tax=Pyrolobus fumarii (strain DSM 11204 / 1A) TaxID=694429 RepID=G0EGE0_PYRF1|nr:hypothetical protein [Pyrolobus fumarii]AEM39165.1 protein of unknown function DUF207 [Pyrolobus fumarii 1A]